MKTSRVIPYRSISWEIPINPIRFLVPISREFYRENRVGNHRYIRKVRLLKEVFTSDLLHFG